MRRLLSTFVVLVCYFGYAQSQNIFKDKVNYVLEGDNAYIVGFDEQATKVTVESAITYKNRVYKVVGVKLNDKSYTPYERKKIAIREMIFAEGVTDVFDKIAENMEMLERVVLSSTVTTIGKSAFKGCRSLVDINNTDSLRIIGQSAFENCSSLREFVIPKKLKSIGTKVFMGCKSLSKIEIQCAINRIPKCTFSHCSSLKSILWIPSFTSIDEDAFRGCTSLKFFKCPKKVKTIGVNAFNSCTSLQKVQLPDELEEIKSGAFANCISLEDITLPSHISTIEQETFKNCERLKIVNIPDSVTSIRDEAFRGCTSLREFIIPAMVNKLGRGTFKNCFLLKTVIFKGKIDEIPFECFSECSGLEEIVIPQSVRNVEMYAFKNCAIKNMILPDSAKYDKTSFYGCGLLTNIKCHNGHTPSDMLAYIPAHCLFALNGGKSENPEFDKPLLASVQNHTIGKKKETTETRKFKYVMRSDVDMSIPKTNSINDSTFAIIIGNENYELVPYVKYAEHDAMIFGEYCKDVLGLSEENVIILYDASYRQMKKAVERIDSISRKRNGRMNVLFYYSGHGIPNESTRDAFILPIDADGRKTDDCYAVSQLYKDLSEVAANRVLVFLDACFSGSQRDGGVLQAAARGVAIRPKSSTPLGNVVVFSAATGDETAYPLEGKSHGLFTYFLLKKIKETLGDVSLGELADYLKKNVGTTSILENKKSQTPTFIPSPSISSRWADMKLQ